MTKIGIINLGCPRNLVDSEVMIAILRKKGYEIADDITSCDIAIVNTCAFINDAKVESIDMIFEIVGLKKKAKIKHIIVAGCLAQRYKEKLKNELKEVDAFIGTGDINRIDVLIEDLLKGEKPYIVSHKPGSIPGLYVEGRGLLTPQHYAYIKIQEGCANQCSFCIIPELRGDLRSRPAASILKEVNGLAKKGGLSELNIIGQDTTSYGYDFDGRSHLAEILRSLMS